MHLRLRDGLTAVPHRSVSANFFEIVGAKPYLGRTFDRSDDRRGAARTLILGYGFWQRQFGGDPRVVGQVLPSTEGAFTVVGVMPPDFRYPADAEAWTPVVADLAAVPPNAMFDQLEDSDVGVLFAIGRLKPQATLAAARTDLNRVVARASRAVPSGRRVEARLTPLVDDILGSARPGMWMLIGAVSVLLLAACANVAGLLLARSAGRRHEIAVRMALGARGPDVVRMIVGQGARLCGGGVLLGLVGSLAAAPVIDRALYQVSAGDPVTFVGLAGFLTGIGLIASYVPARRAARMEPAQALRQH